MTEATKEYKAGDKVWWFNGQIFIRCTITEVDHQWRDQHPDGVLFYNLDEPVGHSLDADELAETLKERFGDAEDWEERDVEGPEPTLENFRCRAVRFILATHLGSPDYGKTDKVTDEMVDKALLEWKYPPKKQGEDWLTFEEAVEKVKRQ